MARHYIKQLAVMAAGFALGGWLGRFVGPSNTWLWIATGVALACYAEAFVSEIFGGDWFLPSGIWHRRH
jgi:hypothetical protein